MTLLSVWWLSGVFGYLRVLGIERDGWWAELVRTPWAFLIALVLGPLMALWPPQGR